MSNHYLDNKYLEKNIIDFQQAKKNKRKYELLKQDYEMHKQNTNKITLHLDEEKIAPAIDEAPFYDHDVNIDQAYRPESKPYTVRTKQYPTPEKPGLNLSQLDKVS